MEETSAASEAAAAGHDEWAGFSAAWQRGFQEVIAIRLVRGRADPRESLGRRPATLARWLALGYGPVLPSLVLPLGDEPTERAALLLLLGTINAGMFAAAALAWRYALDRAHTIDDLLRPCPERDVVPGIIHRAVSRRWQVALPTLFALLPWVVPLLAGTPAWSGWAPVVLAANLTWTMFLLGNVSYWLIIPPLLVIKMRAWRTVALRWNDPARTPGIRTFSEGYAYSALFLALGALAVTVPSLLGAPLFGPYVPYLYALLFGLSLWVGVITQAAIYSMVRRFRLSLLDELASTGDFVLTENRAAEVRERTGANFPNTLAVYGSVVGAPSLPYGTVFLIQYVAALSGSAAGLLLQ